VRLLPRIEQPDQSSQSTQTRSSHWPSRVFVGAVVCFTAVLWFAAFNKWGTSDVPGRLQSSQQFVDDANARCKAAVELIDSGRPASSATSPADRASILDSSNGVLLAMLADLRQFRAGSLTDQDTVDQWLDDWQEYIRLRQAYADKLRDGQDARFTVVRADARSLDARIDAFSSVNSIFSCATPDDV